MPRVTGDSHIQAGSAWLASAPPSWVVPTQKVWVSELTEEAAEKDEALADFLRATLSRSSSVLRRLTKGNAA